MLWMFAGDSDKVAHACCGDNSILPPTPESQWRNDRLSMVFTGVACTYTRRTFWFVVGDIVGEAVCLVSYFWIA